MTPVIDLFALAENNDGAWPERFRQACAVQTPEREALLARFADQVSREGRVAFNMKARTLSHFLASGVRKTVYQVVEEESAATGQPLDDLLPSKLGRWYDRRVTFDNSFEGARDFRYAALWLSGSGCQGYGPYCLVLGGIPSRIARAYVREDSLGLYFTPVGFDLDAFTADLATESHRHELAAVKHAADLPARQTQWGGHLCNQNRYIEAILQTDPGVEAVSAVWTTREEIARHRELAFRSLTGDLEADERAELADVNMVEERLQARHLRLEVSND